MSIPCLILLALLSLTGLSGQTNGYLGSEACATCHSEISASYSLTPMARTSGVATGAEGVLPPPGTFLHERAGVAYQVDRLRDRSVLRYEKGDVKGETAIEYFIGAGHLARSFLLFRNNHLFQAPVTFYAATQAWDTSPGYETDTRVALNRPIEPECLACHAGRIKHREGTRNGYEDQPFLESGIGCERCHGPGRQHASLFSAGAATGSVRGSHIVNPAKLEPRLRDSVCAQCHMPGDVRIVLRGRSLDSFRPGEDLAEYVATFLGGRTDDGAVRTASHFERLALSACKQKSGEDLWCGSCHEAHFVPPPSGKVSFYRGKCQVCHGADRGCTVSAEQRAAAADDCVSCHMPARPAARVDHSAYSDHAIPRMTAARLAPGAANEITPFWSGLWGSREIGLAYARLAVKKGGEPLLERALRLLAQLESVSGDDPEVQLYLGTLYDRRGEEDMAVRLYRTVLRTAPEYTEAAVNLGSILARRGRFEEAAELWEDVLARDPGQEAAAIKLALAKAVLGKPGQAREVLQRSRLYLPDLPTLEQLSGSDSPSGEPSPK